MQALFLLYTTQVKIRLLREVKLKLIKQSFTENIA